jgi:hypothetical protein
LSLALSSWVTRDRTLETLGGTHKQRGRPVILATLKGGGVKTEGVGWKREFWATPHLVQTFILLRARPSKRPRWSATPPSMSRTWWGQRRKPPCTHVERPRRGCPLAIVVEGAHRVATSTVPCLRCQRRARCRGSFPKGQRGIPVSDTGRRGRSGPPRSCLTERFRCRCSWRRRRCGKSRRSSGYNRP